ncbi:MAG: pre-peptidase C-terminal domain-containing protein [Deltaproteobacteria bacterium]|nr:pre-peptidase C-terminal domain-containing protein [Deltaproteobacteria bacterium]
MAATYVYADRVIQFYDSGAGPIPGPYGGTTINTSVAYKPVSTTVVLGPDVSASTASWLSLPTNSFVTVAFSNATIIDGPGADIFVTELTNQGETAEVYASTDGASLVSLGLAQGGRVNFFDLAGRGISGNVREIRVRGLDLRGDSPGFDLLNLGITPTSVGAPPPANTDPNDRIAEAEALPLNSSLVREIDRATDVDMFRIDLQAGQIVAIDIDPTLATFKSNLRVFSYDPLTNIASERARNSMTRAPGENFNLQSGSYLQFTAPSTGFYFLGVSGLGNTGYGPVSGNDGTGSSTGLYRIGVKLLIENLTSTNGLNEIKGRVRVADFGSLTRSTIDVSLQRVIQTQSGPSTSNAIERSRNTWIVVHGRIGTRDDFKTLAGLVDNVETGDQVLLLDWRGGAADNTPASVGLQGAEWIPSVALWAQQVLGQLGIAGSRVRLVGHSWGSYVAHDIGKLFSGGAKAIVALDPAFTGTNYSESGISFKNVSTWSWAFYGGGIFGNARLSGTADEAFYLSYATTPSPTSAHAAPIRLFEYLVGQNHRFNASALPTARARLFNLNNLITAKVGPWSANRYATGSLAELPRQVFEGKFSVASLNGVFSDVRQFKYFDRATNREIPLT